MMTLTIGDEMPERAMTMARYPKTITLRINQFFRILQKKVRRLKKVSVVSLFVI